MNDDIGRQRSFIGAETLMKGCSRLDVGDVCRMGNPGPHSVFEEVSKVVQSSDEVGKQEHIACGRVLTQI